MEALDPLLNRDPTYTMFMSLPVHQVLWGFNSTFIAHLESLIPSIIKKMLPTLPDPFIALQVSERKCYDSSFCDKYSCIELSVYF